MCKEVWHHCLICDEMFRCFDDYPIDDERIGTCDFRNMLLCHGQCYSKLSAIEKAEYDLAIEKLRSVCPKMRKY